MQELGPWVDLLRVGVATSPAWVHTMATATSSKAAWGPSIAARCAAIAASCVAIAAGCAAIAAGCAAIAALGSLVSGDAGCVEACWRDVAVPTAIGAVDLHIGGAKGTGGSRLNRRWLLDTVPPMRGKGTQGYMRKDQG
jgi:hypothetical protein